MKEYFRPIMNLRTSRSRLSYILIFCLFLILNIQAEPIKNDLKNFQGLWYAGNAKIKYLVEDDNVYTFEKDKKVLLVSKITAIKIADKTKAPVANTNTGPVYPSKIITHVGIYKDKVDICDINLIKGMLIISQHRKNTSVVLQRDQKSKKNK